ncbi:HAD family hydrolase [Limnoraphis robusta]|uniref:Haloacid dehalogenase n=1 Tax=Limnoraphis robusta CS-951 TaxID=1637645 RepID=A0A0F5Y7J5_9CYAN|nr:HAD family hydrolase [Limnoraphis robusta]KKD34844.1 haloacid dehalogenase [Limnoraphis robusta CS-951]
MATDSATLLALDFDGVVCDGMIEYFQTAWRTYCRIWSPSDPVPTNDLAQKFYRTRPVIETGWEMPILVRELVKGTSETEILQDWPTIAKQTITEENLDPKTLSTQLDSIRDQWIFEDLPSWLSLHRFYPGVIERVKLFLESSLQLYIITTKEERFVRSLLEQGGVNMAEGTIFGKGEKRPKYEILRELLATIKPTPNIWFVEDRLNTLLTVQQQPDLGDVRLFLADWGYNTQTERNSVSEYPRIQLLSLSEFIEDFSAWG